MTKDKIHTEIRLARPEDYEEVGRITLEAYRSLEAFDNENGYEAVLLDVESRARGAEVFVACLDGVTVGAMTFVPDGGSPMAEWPQREAAGVRMLAIDPSVQGRGLGRVMTEFALERARALGQTLFLLHSASYMSGAHRLYESMGFRRYPEIDFEVEPVILWGYRLDLS